MNNTGGKSGRKKYLRPISGASASLFLIVNLCYNVAKIISGKEDPMLSGKQRSTLRALGNELNPIVIIGKAGLTANVIEQLDQALTARELVKVRVLPHQDFDPGETAADLAAQTDSEVIQVIGRNILFYRVPREGPSKLSWPEEN